MNRYMNFRGPKTDFGKGRAGMFKKRPVSVGKPILSAMLLGYGWASTTRRNFVDGLGNYFT